MAQHSSIERGQRAAPETATSGHLETWLLVLFVAVLGGSWVAQYQPFQLPNNDYHSFERVARSFAALELPATFKRMPVFPALSALLAPWLAGSQPYLDAALIWNQAFSFGTLALLFVLGRRTFGRGAVLVPLLIGTNVQFHLMGLQPLVEPSLTFFSVLAIVLCERGSAWQYAAAGLVALSRYEAGILIPVLFAVNVAFELRPPGAGSGQAALQQGLRWQRFWWHLLLAAAACIGVAAWTALSLAYGRGSGGSFYLQLMEGMGWQPAPGFLERSVKEPFRGWYVRSKQMIPALALVIGVPGLLGLLGGWRGYRRITVVLVVAWLLGVGLIVAFGINKSRYVTHTQWIPVFFFCAGLPDLVRRVEDRLRRVPRTLCLLGACLTGGLAISMAARFVLRLAAEPVVVAPAVEYGLLWTAFVLAAVTLLWIPARGPAPARLAAGFLALALIAPLFGGGLVAKVKGLHKVYYANHSAVVLAPWLAEHLGSDRAVVLPRTHIDYLVGIGPPQLVLFSSFEAETPTELAARLREQGVRYAIYTYRREPDDPSERFYYQLHHMRIAEFFRSGGPVAGFEHVATLPLPVELDRAPIQVYRLAPAEDGGAPETDSELP